MKKNTLITLFISTHIVLIFLQVHKHSLFIKNNYQQQLCEKKIVLLKEQKQLLTQELYALQDRNVIKQFAQKTLHMRPYKLNQIKTIDLS